MAHTDSISSLGMCQRNQRPLVLSGSLDCSVALWDIYGNQIGVFGQVGGEFMGELTSEIEDIKCSLVCLRWNKVFYMLFIYSQVPL